METTTTHSKEYCDKCKAVHTMLDGGDIYDCWNYYRKNNPREDNIEIWDGKKWVKRKN